MCLRLALPAMTNHPGATCPQSTSWRPWFCSGDGCGRWFSESEDSRQFKCSRYIQGVKRPWKANFWRYSFWLTICWCFCRNFRWVGHLLFLNRPIYLTVKSSKNWGVSIPISDSQRTFDYFLSSIQIHQSFPMISNGNRPQDRLSFGSVFNKHNLPRKIWFQT